MCYKQKLIFHQTFHRDQSARCMVSYCSCIDTQVNEGAVAEVGKASSGTFIIQP